MKKLLLLIAVFAALGAGQPTWELAKEKDGIKVYLADAENTSIKQFKVLAFIAASPKAIADAVSDIDNNYKWFENVEKASLVSRASANDFIYKQVVNVPFPMQDREVVQRVVRTQLAGGVIRIDLKEKNDATPKNNDYVRMPMVRGYWLLKPEKGGTQVEYSFLADPGGAIPGWLANQFIVEGPFKTIAALRKYLVK